MSKWREECGSHIHELLARTRAEEPKWSVELLSNDRLDHYWRQVFKIVQDNIEEEPVELIKLEKLLCSLSHGQAGSERGFANTKRIVMDRSSLSDRSVKG